MHDPTDNNSPRRAEELAQRMLDDVLSDAEHRELLAILQSDLTAREWFLEHAYLHALLREQRQAGADSTLPSQLFGVKPEEVSALTARLSGEFARPQATIQAPIPPTDGSSWFSHHSGWLFGTTGFTLPTMCVAAVMGAIAFWAITSLWSGNSLQEGSALGKKPSASKSVEMAALPQPSSLQLASGMAKLVLPKVGYVVLEGPGEFTLLSEKRARLSSGRIKMRVTEVSGRGFVVETPYGEITDLGTEFGVDLTEQGKASVVVFEGAIDLRVSQSQVLDASKAQRLVGGEGIIFGSDGRLDRIMSIVTGTAATFLRAGTLQIDEPNRIIASISDNIRSPSFKKFYEIVPKGLREEALAFVEWPLHEWNGADAKGIPPYLIDADYVKPFDTDKLRSDLEIYVEVASPARLFVFFDKRVPAPSWLTSRFRETGDLIGLDAGPLERNGVRYIFHHGEGPGNSLDAIFSVWELIVDKPGVVTLGPNAAPTDYSSMYGIAAIKLESLHDGSR
jgi:hypothetical protein